MKPIGAVLAGPANPPPPVHAGSCPLGACEAELWRPTPPALLDAIREGARLARLNGARLGRLALDVLAVLADRVDWRTGRLDPSYEDIADEAGASRSGVALALSELREAGFLTWVRRYVPTGQDGTFAPQVWQTSNAYRLCLPPAAERLLAQAGEVRAMIRAASQARRAAEREARTARWAEARAAREAQRAEMEEARDRAARRAPLAPSPAPRQDERSAFAAALATAERLRGQRGSKA